jgi:hypothetical protein
MKMRHLPVPSAAWRRFALVGLLSLTTWRCTTSTQDPFTDGGSTMDAGMPSDGGFDAGQQVYILTIANYLDWCAITGLGDAGYLPTAAFVAGTVVPLEASPLPGYVWGYWTGTDGADGGHDLNMHTTVTMDANKQVVACCPQEGGAPVCPTPMP